MSDTMNTSPKGFSPMRQVMVVVCFWLVSAMVFSTVPASAQEGYAEIAARQGMATEIIEVSWVPAESLVDLVEPFLTEHGSVVADPGSNMLIVVETPGNMSQIRNVIAQFDRPQPQVRIQARLVKASENFLNRLGVAWSSGQGFGNGNSLVVLNGDIQPVDAAINARSQSGHAQLESTLNVTTLALERAELAMGSSLPIPGGHGATDYRDVVVALAVTPRVMPGNRLRLAVEVRGETTSNPLQGIDISSASTVVEVANGQAVAIGSADTVTSGGSGQNVPLLGYGFTERQAGGGRRSLVIFVSAEILD